MPISKMGRERKLMYKRDCVECGKEIMYSPFSFDENGQPTGEFAHITRSGLCSNTIDGCWEKNNL